MIALLTLLAVFIYPNPWHIHNTNGLDITNPVPVVWNPAPVTPPGIPIGVPVPPPPTPGSWWKPDTSPQPLYWILSRSVTTSETSPGIWDIDGETNSEAVVTALHAKGAKVICYVDAGTYEPGRSDSNSLLPYRGNGVAGWPGEYWLDIRQVDALRPIMQARMAACKAKGFDAIEPDNIDGYQNSSGFPLTSTDQLVYNKMLADTAHSLGLSIGLKNDVDQIAQLEPWFDWALNEECYDYNECGGYSAFVNAGKAVWIAEYRTLTTSMCGNAATNHYNLASYDLDLSGQRSTC